MSNCSVGNSLVHEARSSNGPISGQSAPSPAFLHSCHHSSSSHPAQLGAPSINAPGHSTKAEHCQPPSASQGPSSSCRHHHHQKLIQQCLLKVHLSGTTEPPLTCACSSTRVCCPAVHHQRSTSHKSRAQQQPERGLLSQ